MKGRNFTEIFSQKDPFELEEEEISEAFEEETETGEEQEDFEDPEIPLEGQEPDEGFDEDFDEDFEQEPGASFSQ